jgi:hypothetical protein
MNTAYLIYQAERTKTAAEQREVDAAHAQLAVSLAELWRWMVAPLRSRLGRVPGVLRLGTDQKCRDGH